MLLAGSIPGFLGVRLPVRLLPPQILVDKREVRRPASAGAVPRYIKTAEASIPPPAHLTVQMNSDSSFVPCMSMVLSLYGSKKSRILGILFF